MKTKISNLDSYGGVVEESFWNLTPRHWARLGVNSCTVLLDKMYYCCNVLYPIVLKSKSIDMSALTQLQLCKSILRLNSYTFRQACHHFHTCYYLQIISLTFLSDIFKKKRILFVGRDLNIYKCLCVSK